MDKLLTWTEGLWPFHERRVHSIIGPSSDETCLALLTCAVFTVYSNQQFAREFLSLCGHLFAISDLTLSVFGPLFFMIVTFSSTHTPQIPPGATGARLPIILQVMLGAGLRFCPIHRMRGRCRCFCFHF